MFRKVFILLLIAVSLKKPRVEATTDLLSGIIAMPFNLADDALSFMRGAITNAVGIASTLTKTATSAADLMASHVLSCSHRLVDSALGGLSGVLSILRSAGGDISATLTQFSGNILTAKNDFLAFLTKINKGLIQGSIENGKQLIVGCTQSGQVFLDKLGPKYEAVMKDVSSCADCLIKEAMNEGNATKAAIVEAIAENIKKLQKEYINVRQNLRDAVKTTSDKLTNFHSNITIKEAETKIKDVIKVLTTAWNMGIKNIDQMNAHFEKLCDAASGEMSQKLQSRVDSCKNQFADISKNVDNFIGEIKKSALQLIKDFAEKSKNGVGTFFNSSLNAFADSVSGVESIVGSTVTLTGDFMKNRVQSITDAKKHILVSLEDLRKATGNTLDKITNVAEDSVNKLVKLKSNILDTTFGGFIEIIKGVDNCLTNGGSAIRGIADQTIQMVSTAKTEITAAINDDIKHIQGIYKNAAETIKGITAGIAGALKDATEKLGVLFSKTITTIRSTISNKVKSFTAIVEEGAGSVRMLVGRCKSAIRKFRNNLQSVLETFRNDTKIRVSEALQAIHNLSAEFVAHMQKTFVQGSKKYLECSKATREKLDRTMSSLAQEIHACGKSGLMNVMKTIDTALELEGGLSPKVEKLVTTYEKCKSEILLGGLRCLGKISAEKTLGLSAAVVNIIQGTTEAGKSITHCTMEQIAEAKKHFAQQKMEFDNCVK